MWIEADSQVKEMVLKKIINKNEKINCNAKLCLEEPAQIIH